MSENDIQHRIQLALSNSDVRLFRNNVGAAWMGSDFTVRAGRLVSGNARYVRYGLAEGSSDLIGLTRTIITPEMVGRPIAVFTAIEVKDKKKQTAEQRSFITMVNTMGGCAGIARSVDDAQVIVNSIAK